MSFDVPLVCLFINYRLKGHNINLDPLKYPELHQLKVINDIEVGVLIGLHHYWDILIGNPVRDTQNLVALEAKLGYILAGPVYSEIHGNNSVATFFANVAFNQEESIKRGVAQILGIIDK